jgi:hypothetical protein
MNELINPMEVAAWWWWQGNEEEERREGNPIQFGAEPNDSHPRKQERALDSDVRLCLQPKEEEDEVVIFLYPQA